MDSIITRREFCAHLVVSGTGIATVGAISAQANTATSVDVPSTLPGYQMIPFAAMANGSICGEISDNVLVLIGEADVPPSMARRIVARLRQQGRTVLVRATDDLKARWSSPTNAPLVRLDAVTVAEVENQTIRALAVLDRSRGGWTLYRATSPEFDTPFTGVSQATPNANRLAVARSIDATLRTG